MVPRALDTVDRWIAAHRTRVERRLDRLGTYLDAAAEADKEDIMTERTDRHATIVIQRSFFVPRRRVSSRRGRRRTSGVAGTSRAKTG